jgi:hypothetical protein
VPFLARASLQQHDRLIVMLARAVLEGGHITGEGG